MATEFSDPWSNFVHLNKTLLNKSITVSTHFYLVFNELLTKYSSDFWKIYSLSLAEIFANRLLLSIEIREIPDTGSSISIGYLIFW